MKKWIVLIVGISSCVLLTGCTKKQETKILFDNSYVLTLQTIDRYQETTNTSKNNNILKIYLTTKNQSGFQSSLLIGKQEIASGTSLETFTENNIKTEVTKAGISISKESHLTTSCNSGEMAAEIKGLQIKQGKQTMYISQLYFIQHNVGYIVSSMTSSSKENKNFLASFKSLTCIN